MWTPSFKILKKDILVHWHLTVLAVKTWVYYGHWKTNPFTAIKKFFFSNFIINLPNLLRYPLILL